MLWHYTSADVLASILSGSVPTLRATHIHYLNDKAELCHGLNSIKLKLNAITPSDVNQLTAFTQKIAPSIDPSFGKAVPSGTLASIDKISNSVNKLLDKTFDPNLFSFSLSEAEDSLYQWLAYSPKEGGIALGFDIDRDKIEKDQVIYLPVSGINSIEVQLPRYKKCQYIKDSELPLDWFEPLLDKNIDVNLLVSAMFLKHKAFHFEQEHRLFFHPMNNHKVEINFQNGKPFITFHFKPEILKSIYISPRGNTLQTEKLVRKILDVRGLYDVEIIVSDIPFRE